MPRRQKRDQDGIFERPDSPFWWASTPDRADLRRGPIMQKVLHRATF